MQIHDLFDLHDRTVVVTGGGGLYGSAFVTALSAAGADVILTSRTTARAEAEAARLDGDSGTVRGIALDLADESSVRDFAASVGPVDVLVNNAVHRAGGDLFDTTAADLDATAAVNWRGTFLLTQAIGARMAERGAGSIINIGSIYGLVAPEFDIYADTDMTMPAFYSYDKAGLVGFTRYLAARLGPSGVRANCLCPGGLEDGSQPAPFLRAYTQRVPLGRLAQVEDVAGAIVFLASDASSYVTGVTLPVDGGWSAK
jgi:NAD(P)-dependent dehydrogenase (short-subunit alcohol dehydrogenase family)